MSWMKLQDSFLHNRKFPRLKKLLGCDSIVTVRGHVTTLWLNVLVQSPDGILQGWDNIDIALASGWENDENLFVEAMKNAALLDWNNDLNCYEVHNWMEYAGSYKIAERKRKSRKKTNMKDDPVSTLSRPSVVTVTTRGEEKNREENKTLVQSDQNPTSEKEKFIEEAHQKIEEKLSDRNPFIEIPLKDKTFHQVKIEDVEYLKQTYPTVNVKQELRSLTDWNISNLAKRKTKTGINKHISLWMQRATDKENGNGFNRKPSNPDGALEGWEFE